MDTIELITKVDDNKIAIEQQPIVYSKEEIDAKCSECDTRIANNASQIYDLQNANSAIESEYTIRFERKAKAEELGIKTIEELETPVVEETPIVSE